MEGTVGDGLLDECEDLLDVFGHVEGHGVLGLAAGRTELGVEGDLGGTWGTRPGTSGMFMMLQNLSLSRGLL
jgi:hypothetical protein